MNIKYLQETDTLYIEFRKGEGAETRELDENMMLDVGADGGICPITVEQASERADIPHFSFEQVAAGLVGCHGCGLPPRNSIHQFLPTAGCDCSEVETSRASTFSHFPMLRI